MFYKVTGVESDADAYLLAILLSWVLHDPAKGQEIYGKGLLEVAALHYENCPECQQLLADSGLMAAPMQADAFQADIERLMTEDPAFRERMEEGARILEAERQAAEARADQGKILHDPSMLSHQHETMLEQSQAIWANFRVSLILTKHIEGLLAQ